MVWNFRSRERKFQELSLPGTFVPWNFHSRERKFQKLSLPGAKVPGSESSWERKFHNSLLIVSKLSAPLPPITDAPPKRILQWWIQAARLHAPAHARHVVEMYSVTF